MTTFAELTPESWDLRRTRVLDHLTSRTSLPAVARTELADRLIHDLVGPRPVPPRPAEYALLGRASRAPRVTVSSGEDVVLLAGLTIGGELRLRVAADPEDAREMAAALVTHADYVDGVRP